MPRKQRDYKAEYARRNARAKQQGTTYGKQRRVKAEAIAKAEGFKDAKTRKKVLSEISKLIDYLEESGYDFDNMPDRDDPNYWEWFRANYKSSSSAA